MHIIPYLAEIDKYDSTRSLITPPIPLLPRRLRQPQPPSALRRGKPLLLPVNLLQCFFVSHKNFPFDLLLFDGVAADEIALRVETVLMSVTNGILDFLPDVGSRQLRIEVIGLFDPIPQRHPRLLLGDERPPPHHLAGLRILLLHNISHLNLPLKVTRLFTLKGAPLIGKKNMKSRKNHFIHRPESRHRAIKRGRATDEPTDQPSNRRDNPTTLSPPAGSCLIGF